MEFIIFMWDTMCQTILIVLCNLRASRLQSFLRALSLRPFRTPTARIIKPVALMFSQNYSCCLTSDENSPYSKSNSHKKSLIELETFSSSQYNLLVPFYKPVYNISMIKTGLQFVFWKKHFLRQATPTGSHTWGKTPLFHQFPGGLPIV